MERAKAVDELAARCEARPGSVVTELLARLRGRPDEVAATLRGDPLRVELLFTGWTPSEAWLVFTALGNVAAVVDRAALGRDVRPHLLFRGTPEEILRVVLGVVPVREAVTRGLFVPLVPTTRFTRLLRLVAHELAAAAET